jgi:hypothetical protein
MSVPPSACSADEQPIKTPLISEIPANAAMIFDLKRVLLAGLLSIFSLPPSWSSYLF